MPCCKTHLSPEANLDHKPQCKEFTRAEFGFVITAKLDVLLIHSATRIHKADSRQIYVNAFYHQGQAKCRAFFLYLHNINKHIQKHYVSNGLSHRQLYSGGRIQSLAVSYGSATFVHSYTTMQRRMMLLSLAIYPDSASSTLRFYHWTWQGRLSLRFKERQSRRPHHSVSHSTHTAPMCQLPSLL